MVSIYFGVLFQGFTVVAILFATRPIVIWIFFSAWNSQGTDALVFERITSHRNLTIKIVVIIILLAIVTLTNIGVRSIDNS